MNLEQSYMGGMLSYMKLESYYRCLELPCIWLEASYIGSEMAYIGL